MNHHFRRYCFVFVASLCFSFCNAQQKPNVIFILTDDHRWDALGAMGNRIIQTPNLDQLAAEGILFRNAYVTTSICCVSRASILSGQYASRHHINDFSTDFTDTALANTYPLLFKAQGYHTGFVGKYGVGYAHQPINQFDFWACTKQSQPDYLVKRPDGSTIHHTDSTGNSILQFLDNWGTKGPFCLSVGFKAPHEQDGNPPEFITQPRFDSLYKKINIPEPLTADSKYWSSFPDFFKTDSNIARVRWQPLFATHDEYEQTVKKYYRLITGVDEVVGKLRKRLKELGIEKNTIIVFMGDNGFFLGEHGMEGKWYGYEESIRVPLIVYDPRQQTTDKKIDAQQIALNIDIAPTLLSLAGLPVPAEMQGYNLMNPAVHARKDFFYEHQFLGGRLIPRSEGVVAANIKYLNYIDFHYEELYDLSKDPHETNNLAREKADQSLLKKMRERYEALKKAVK